MNDIVVPYRSWAWPSAAWLLASALLAAAAASNPSHVTFNLLDVECSLSAFA